MTPTQRNFLLYGFAWRKLFLFSNSYDCSYKCERDDDVLKVPRRSWHYWMKKLSASRPSLCVQGCVRAFGPGPYKIFSKKQYVGGVEGRRRGSPQSCWEPQRSQWTHVAKLFIGARKNCCETICPKNLCRRRLAIASQNTAVKSKRDCYNDAPISVIALVIWGYWNIF